MGRKTRARYRMSLNTKYEDTAPERVFREEVALPLGIFLEGQPSVRFPDVTLTPDFKVLNSNVYISIDGEKFHAGSYIQRNKDSWRDGLLISRGLRVLHIESELLICHGIKDTRKFLPHVACAFSEFLMSTERVRYLKA